MPALPAAWLFLIAVNVAAFVAFGTDKQCARAGTRRLSERWLHLLALLGGTPGTYLGRAIYRHKTRQAGFSRVLHAIALAQIVLILWFLNRS